MTKKEIVERLEELKIDFDPETNKNELENVLAAAEKEVEAVVEPTPEAPEIEKEKLKNYGEGLKQLKVTHAEMEAMRPQLVGYIPNKEDPYSGGIAIIKG